MTKLIGQSVLVTGATGFLGGALARRLIADGAHVRALVRAPDKADAVRALGVELVQGDVTEADSVLRALENQSIVFHAVVSYGDLAAQTAVNIEGTRNMAHAAADAGVTRFVHVSTISWYGYGQRGDVTEDTPPNHAHDPYVRTKQAAENVVRDIGAARGLTYAISRPGMIYGAGGTMWTRNLFQLARRRPTPFIGAGRGSVFPIHIDDVVDQLVTLATHPAARNQAFNCTPDPSPTWREFLGLYAHIAGHQRWLALPYAPMAALARLLAWRASKDSVIRDLPSVLRIVREDATYKMDKARHLLNWIPRVDLETGVAGCAAWLREQGLL
ncbi:MAG: NAD-dependent epimerase/dehydratase family protein [Chloroflexota bacterium]|nr:NAD-dependent epimerase/dehydratase family protein [Chloroflexota bacterium]